MASFANHEHMSQLVFVRSVVVPVNSKSIYRGSHWQRERRADGWSFQCYIVISGTITIPSITIYGPNHSLAPSAQEISSAVPDQSNSSFLPMPCRLHHYHTAISRKKLPNSKLKSLQNTNCWTVSHSLPGSSISNIPCITLQFSHLETPTFR